MSSYSVYGNAKYGMFNKPRKYLSEDGTPVEKIKIEYTQEQSEYLVKTRARFKDYLNECSKTSSISSMFAKVIYSILEGLGPRQFKDLRDKVSMFNSNAKFVFAKGAYERERLFLCIFERWLEKTHRKLTTEEVSRITKHFMDYHDVHRQLKNGTYFPYFSPTRHAFKKWTIQRVKKVTVKNQLKLNQAAHRFTSTVKMMYTTSSIPLKAARLLYQLLNNLDDRTMNAAWISEFEQTYSNGQWVHEKKMRWNEENFNRWRNLMDQIKADQTKIGCKCGKEFNEVRALLDTEYNRFKISVQQAAEQKILKAQKRREERAAKKAAEKKRLQEEHYRRDAENIVFDITSI